MLLEKVVLKFYKCISTSISKIYLKFFSHYKETFNNFPVFTLVFKELFLAV